jgi:opacity protein-like surface antigen
MKDPRDYSGEAGPRKRIRDALLHCCWTRVILSNLRQTGGPDRQTVMVKRRLRNTLQSSFHIGSGVGGRALERMTLMKSKDSVQNIALAAAMFGVLPLAGLCALAEPAASADFGQPFPGLAVPAPRDDRVEFASNWYVRGDLAYAQETFPNISPFTFGSSPSVLNSYSAGIGMGYKVNNWFRTDLILDYRSQLHAAGNNSANCEVVLPDVITGLPAPTPEICNGHSDSKIRRWDLLANGYLDLGTWDGFTPYIGAGAGVTWARINQSVNFTFNGQPCFASCGFPTAPVGTFIFADFDRSQSSTNWRFAWAAMAGIAIAMTDHAQLDVGYRFLDLGTVTGLSSATGTTVTQRVRANEVRAGVRYTID